MEELYSSRRYHASEVLGIVSFGRWLSDVDIAQFQNVYVAVEEQLPPVLDLLKNVDKTFRPVPHIHKRNVTGYIAKGGLRVDFLTPNEGRGTDVPQPLRAFQTDAEPLRFLDF